MKKTVLFLMNGMGIEQKNSYNIYSSELMPNLDRFIREHFFTSISSSALDYEKAYQLFSIDTLQPLSYPHIENILENNLMTKNPKFNQFHQSVFQCQGNIHFFCFVEEYKTFDSIKQMLALLDKEHQKKFYLHFVMTQKDTSQYANVRKMIARFQYELPSNVVVGFILGIELFENEAMINELNDFIRMFYNGIGEKWKEIDVKFNSLSSMGIPPNKAKAFYVNNGFLIGENDLLFFMNFQNYDCSRFIHSLSKPSIYIANPIDSQKITYYSLFPLANTEDTVYLYDNVTSDISIAKACAQTGTTSLILTAKDSLPTINYMCNGLSNVSDNHIKYVLTDNGILFNRAQMNMLLNDPNYQIIIIDHRIDQIEDENTLKEKLRKIDENMGMIAELCSGQYPLLISSLFGMKKDLLVQDGSKQIVDFSVGIPVVLNDST